MNPTAKHVDLAMKPTLFADIYSERENDSGWNAVQALTLLKEAKKRKCSSLVIYAAMETRMAIELQLFHIITMAKEGATTDLLRECKKKDGLFRMLGEVAPKYTMSCIFLKTLREYDPRTPVIAEWDIKILQKHFTALSDLCHSQLAIVGMDAHPTFWTKKLERVEEALNYLVSKLGRPTALYRPEGANPNIRHLWEQFMSGAIKQQDVRERLAFVAPTLSSRFKHERKGLKIDYPTA